MVSQADNVLLFAEFYAAALLHYHSSLHNICRVQFPDPSSLFRNSVMVPNYGHDEDGAAKEAKRLAHYIVEVLVPKQGLIGQYKMVPVGVREFRKDATHYEALPVQSWLNILVKVLHEAPEDLVTQGKEGKEPLGGKLLMIEKMQETMVDDEKIAVLEERVEEGKAPCT